MQVEIRFENPHDDEAPWTALRMSRFLCDIQRFATVVQNLPIGGSQHLSRFDGFDSDYAEIITADLSRRATLHPEKADAVISIIKKAGPLVLVVDLPGLASVSSPLVRQLCRLVTDLQGVVGPTRHRSNREIIAKRLKGLRDYAALWESLDEAEDRERLDAIVVGAIEALADGRYPKMRKMGRVKAHESKAPGPTPRLKRAGKAIPGGGKSALAAAKPPVRPANR